MSNVVAPIDKARIALFKQMTPATQEIANEFNEKIRKGVESSVKVKYDIGAKLAVVVAEENEYGSNAVKLLAQYCAIEGGEPTLYNLMNLAAAFTREYIVEQCSIPLADGKFLTLSHWLQLMKIKEPKKQESMLNRVRKENLSAGDLEKEVRAGAGGNTKHARQGGRKPKAPSSPIVGLQKTFDLANKFLRWEEVANTTTFEVIEEMSPDKVDENLLKKAELTLDMVTKAETAATEMKGHLEENVERIKAVLEKKSEEAAEGYDEEDASPKKKKSAEASTNGKKKKKKKKKPVAAE